jgi:endonuclease
MNGKCALYASKSFAMNARLRKRRENSAVAALKEQDADKSRLNSIWLSSDTFCVKAPDTTPSHDSKYEGFRTARSAKRFLESVINKHVVVICAAVRVEYEGRASSVADLSRRIVITKPDGTLIIHEDTKHRPLNWQPPGTSFQLSVKNESTLMLEAFRKKDRETVTIWFEKVFYIAASRITPGEFRFSGSEAEMVDLVMRNPGLVEEGFTPEKKELRIKYGTVDLIGKDREGNILVLEFKRKQAQLASASQLDRYVQHLMEREHLRVAPKPARGGEKRQAGLQATNQRPRGGKSKVRGGIVAPAITAEALALLKKLGYEFFRLNPKLIGRSRFPTTISGT